MCRPKARSAKRTFTVTTSGSSMSKFQEGSPPSGFVPSTYSGRRLILAASVVAVQALAGIIVEPKKLPVQPSLAEGLNLRMRRSRMRNSQGMVWEWWTVKVPSMLERICAVSGRFGVIIAMAHLAVGRHGLMGTVVGLELGHVPG